MKKREYIDYLQDILGAVEAIEEFIEGTTYEDFALDKKTTFAVIRALEIIGEAAKNVPFSIRREYAEIPWNDMSGMRNKVIHEYFGVDLKVVWKTITGDIPKVKIHLRNMLEEGETSF